MRLEPDFALPNINKMLISGREIFETVNVDSIITFISKKTSEKINIYEYFFEKPSLLHTIDKKIIDEPFNLDTLFSRHLQLLIKISSNKLILSDLATCENACSTSDAYKLKPLIENLDNQSQFNDNFLYMINTGTIDKYVPKWGNRSMVYLGNRYLFPVVNKEVFLRKFNNTYGQKTLKRKIIIKGLTLLDGCLDESGNIIPGKSTLLIPHDDLDKLKLILGFLNSRIAIFYLKEKYSASSYNTGINFTKEMINNLPIPYITEDKKIQIIDLVDKVTQEKRTEFEADTISIENSLNNILYDLYDLNKEEILLIEGKINSDNLENVDNFDEMSEIHEETSEKIIGKYDLCKCSVCGALVMSFDKKNHEIEKHKGNPVEWKKIG